MNLTKALSCGRINHKPEEKQRQLNARRSVEDAKIAKELGITVKELNGESDE